MSALCEKKAMELKVEGLTKDASQSVFEGMLSFYNGAN